MNITNALFIFLSGHNELQIGCSYGASHFLGKTRLTTHDCSWRKTRAWYQLRPLNVRIRTNPFNNSNHLLNLLHYDQRFQLDSIKRKFFQDFIFETFSLLCEEQHFQHGKQCDTCNLPLGAAIQYGHGWPVDITLSISLSVSAVVTIYTNLLWANQPVLHVN